MDFNNDIILGDFTDSDWLLLVEDDGPSRCGRVLGYQVYPNQAAAQGMNSLGVLCDELGLFIGEEIPQDVCTEIMSYGDFKASYGNRMPLNNRGSLADHCRFFRR
jgi:hypothetical protein